MLDEREQKIIDRLRARIDDICSGMPFPPEKPVEPDKWHEEVVPSKKTCEGTKHRFNLSRLADGDAPWLCECGAVEWMEENGNLDCVSLDLEKVMRTAQERHTGIESLERWEEQLRQEAMSAAYEGIPEQIVTIVPQLTEDYKGDSVCLEPDHLIEPPK